MKVILLIVIGFSLLNAEFTKSNDMVTDSKTGLIWQDNTVSDTMTWQNAIDYCESLTLGDENDWKLPNKKELLSIVDYTSRNYPVISSVFQHTSPSYYWSSTAYAPHTYQAWYVSFYYGGTSAKAKNDSLYVRCVRE